MKTDLSRKLRSSLFAASVAGIAAVALVAPALADEVSTTETTTTTYQAPPPPPQYSTTTTYYAEGPSYVPAPPPVYPAPEPGVSVGIPGIFGVHVGG